MRGFREESRPSSSSPPEKTRVVYLGDGGQGFDFPGFHHHLVRSWTYRKRYCHRWPSKRAMASIRAKIKAITAPRDRLKWSTDALVQELNPVLRGWGNYFRWGNSTRQFTQVDSYVRERLALHDARGGANKDDAGVKCTRMPGSRASDCTSSLGRSVMALLRKRPREHRRRAG